MLKLAFWREFLNDKLTSLDTYVDLSFLIMLYSIFARNTASGVNYLYYVGFFLFLSTTLIKLFYRFREKGTVILPYATLWLLLFILFGLTSVFWAQSRSECFQVISPLIQCAGVTFMMAQHYSTQDGLERCLKLISLAGTLTVIYIFIVTPSSQWFIGALGQATGNNPNTVGMMLQLCALISFYFVDVEKKYSYIIPLVLQSATVVLTSSRKSVLCIAAGILIIAVLNVKRKSYLPKIVLVLTLILITAYFIMHNPLLYDALGRRFKTLMVYLDSNTGDNSMYLRSTFISVAKDLFFEHPVLGVGINNFSYCLGTVFKFGTYAHNNYYEILADLGFTGFMLFYGFYLYLIINVLSIFRSGSKLAVLMLAVMTAILLSEMGIVTYYKPFLYVFLSLPAMFIAAHYGRPDAGVPEDEINRKNIMPL